MKDNENLISSPVLLTIGSAICRICQMTGAIETLISPCLCKGSMAYVHMSCLSRWLNQASRSYCELCMFRFNTIQTRRYTLLRSLRIWIRHPRNWPTIRANLVIMALLTVFTLGLNVLCLLGIHHFTVEGQKVGIAPIWTSLTVTLFLSMVVTVYIITVALFFKDQVVPWYSWWRRCVNVQLLLDGPERQRTSPLQLQNSFRLLSDIASPSDI